jgi:APA family basic amino acid/polyamine antiporter
MTIKIDYFADGFSLLGPLAAGVLLVANSIAMSGTKRTSLLNWIAFIASASFCHCFYYCCGVYSFQELKFGTLFSE